jgi:TnsA-like endonuclease N terminal
MMQKPATGKARCSNRPDEVIEDEVVVPGEAVMLIKRFRDYSPMRKIVNGRRKRPTGRIFSHKANRHLHYESQAERTGILFGEFRSDVISMATQPVQLSWRTEGTKHRYTPDRLEFCDDQDCIVEVKASPTDVDEADIARWQHASKAFAALGWRFRVEFADGLKRSLCYPAVREVNYYSNTPVSDYEVDRVERLFSSPRACLELRQLESILGSPNDTKAKVCALIVRRVLAMLPLSELGPETLVRKGKGAR